MKVTFEFDDEAEDIETQFALFHASRNYSILWELKHNFWRKWKHLPEGSTEEYARGIDEVIERLKEYLEEFIEP